MSLTLSSAPRLLRPFGVRREGYTGDLSAAVDDGVSDDHQGEPPANGKHTPHKYDFSQLSLLSLSAQVSLSAFPGIKLGFHSMSQAPLKPSSRSTLYVGLLFSNHKL